MMVLLIEALAAIALCLSVPMAGAWLVQQRTGNAGRVDTIRIFSAGPVGANYFFELLGWLAYPVIAISSADPLYRLRTDMFVPLPQGVVT